jgi:type I restriction enzyme, S subunit
MNSGWIRTSIGEQATLQRGFDITKVAQTAGHVPVVSSGGISSYHDSSPVRGPGVVLGRKGVVGSVYYLPTDYWPHDTTLWIKDFHGNEPRFVYYFFKAFAPRLARLDVGSANPTLNRNHVHPIEVDWPPPEQQVAVVNVLGALDDKIELNRRIMDASEAFLRAAYNSIKDRRPATLSDIATFVRDGVSPADLPPETAYIGLEHMPQSSLTLQDWGVVGRVASGKSRFRVKDVLFGKLRPYFHKVGIAPVDGVCSQELLVLRPIRPPLLAATLIEASSNEIVAYATAVSSGTRMPRVNWQELASFPIRVPIDSVLADFNQLADQLIDLLIRYVHENRTLGDLRDALLPELISGRMTLN